VSYAFANPIIPSLGASGAVFGLLGAFLVLNRKLGRDSSAVIALIVINLAFGFVATGIDWRAHIGGMIFGGLCAAAIAYAPETRRTAWQVGGLVLAFALVVVIVVWRTAALQV
jgi:membrane associated rhomboid family serine protease